MVNSILSQSRKNTMTVVFAENFEFEYLEEAVSFDRLRPHLVSSQLSKSLWDSVIKHDMSDYRAILLPLLPTSGKGVYFLHWDDDTDLQLLDKKVIENQYADSDFNNSIITYFGIVSCLSCSWKRYGLLDDPGLPHPGIPGLEEAKFKRRFGQGGYLTKCPNCTAPIKTLPVKVFDHVLP